MAEYGRMDLVHVVNKNNAIVRASKFGVAMFVSSVHVCVVSMMGVATS